LFRDQISLKLATSLLFPYHHSVANPDHSKKVWNR